MAFREHGCYAGRLTGRSAPHEKSVREERAHWWFILPILLLVVGVVPAAALQNLIDARVTSTTAALQVSPGDPDAVQQADAGNFAAAVESTQPKLDRELRLPLPVSAGIPDDDCRACLARAALTLPPAADGGRGDSRYQFHTQSLQL